jgi:hypothetical protein
MESMTCISQENQAVLAAYVRTDYELHSRVLFVSHEGK